MSRARQARTAAALMAASVTLAGCEAPLPGPPVGGNPYAMVDQYYRDTRRVVVQVCVPGGDAGARYGGTTIRLPRWMVSSSLHSGPKEANGRTSLGEPVFEYALEALLPEVRYITFNRLTFSADRVSRFIYEVPRDVPHKIWSQWVPALAYTEDGDATYKLMSDPDERKHHIKVADPPKQAPVIRFMLTSSQAYQARSEQLHKGKVHADFDGPCPVLLVRRIP